MQLDCDLLGQCPVCSLAITEAGVVIRYDPRDGWPLTIAACPRCDELVHPS